MSQMPSHLWRPVLEPDLQQQAWEAVDAIAGALSQPAVKDDGGRRAYQLANQAMLHAYLGVARSSESSQEVARQLLEAAIDAVGETQMTPALYGGFTGVAWVVEHLSQPYEGADASDADGDPNAGIDEALHDYLNGGHWTTTYDLISGLVGLGIYALERLPRPTATASLKLIIDHLAKMGEHTQAGLTWKTPPEQLIPDTRKNYPEGYYNLGLAHGVPGVVGLLGEACARGIEPDKAKAMLADTVRWVWAQKLDGPSCFSCWAAAGYQPQAVRSAWCYGDPGVAAPLLLAARAVGDAGWEQMAREVALRAARRSPSEAGVTDPGLCHGAGGLAHLFNRMYQATGEPDLLEAARRWYRRLLEMRQPDKGIGGFQSWTPDSDRQLAWRDDAGFLTGSTGVGLALLAAMTPVEPLWDRLLMVAIPPIAF